MEERYFQSLGNNSKRQQGKSQGLKDNPERLAKTVRKNPKGFNKIPEHFGGASGNICTVPFSGQHSCVSTSSGDLYKNITSFISGCDGYGIAARPQPGVSDLTDADARDLNSTLLMYTVSRLKQLEAAARTALCCIVSFRAPLDYPRKAAMTYLRGQARTIDERQAERERVTKVVREKQERSRSRSNAPTRVVQTGGASSSGGPVDSDPPTVRRVWCWTVVQRHPSWDQGTSGDHLLGYPG